MELEDLRLAIYRGFASTGRRPTHNDLASKFGLPETEIVEGLSELAKQRYIALDNDSNLLMAHPFSAIPLGFSVMGKQTIWWGGCAWDSFALPHLLKSDPEVLVATNCPNCNKALAWNVNNQAAPAGEEIAHFLVPVSRMWDDVVHTCGNQRIYCSNSCLDDWLDKTNQQKGYVMSLKTLWDLASNWYSGRLDEGYVRREPAAAKEYFRSVGLAGSFWGLSD